MVKDNLCKCGHKESEHTYYNGVCLHESNGSFNCNCIEFVEAKPKTEDKIYCTALKKVCPIAKDLIKSAREDTAREIFKEIENRFIHPSQIMSETKYDYSWIIHKKDFEEVKNKFLKQQKKGGE